MFGLSWGQIIIIVLVAAFVLGPERIPTAVNYTLGMIRKTRSLAAGTQATLLRDLAPEIEELRRQVADLQSLKELVNLQPQHWVGNALIEAPPKLVNTDPELQAPVVASPRESHLEKGSPPTGD